MSMVSNMTNNCANRICNPLHSIFVADLQQVKDAMPLSTAIYNVK